MKEDHIDDKQKVSDEKANIILDQPNPDHIKIDLSNLCTSKVKEA